MHSIVRFPDGVIVEVNDTFAKTLGYRREDVLGKTPLELKFWVTPEKLPAFRNQLETQGSVRNFELDVRAKDGSVRTVLLSSELVDIDGVPHSMSAGVDITDRKRAEAQLREGERQLRESETRLRESEARFSAAFHASPVLMTIATLPDGTFVEVNDAFIKALGLGRDQIIGRNSLELNLWLSPTDRTRFFENLNETRSLRDVESQARGRDGSVRTLQISANIIEINRKPHLLTCALDITERKQAEIELQRSLQQERELGQLKSDFVSLVSHEFRTPLEVIMSSAENLERYHERLKPDKRQHLLRTIHRSVRRMTDMM
jgi:PAS domain S-box-containing protein